MIRRCKNRGRANDTKSINNVPNDVLDSILERLPIEDLVKTSLLSKRWRYKWTSIPRIEFQNSFFDKCGNLDTLEILTIVTEVLLAHTGPINSFIFYIPTNIPIRYECLNKWILFLSTKEIKFLELYNIQQDPFQTPSNIFSCLGLTHLELGNFKLSNVPNFAGFKSLVTLRLSDVIFECNELGSLVFDCPSLVILSLMYCSGFESINVSSPALKYFRFQAVRVIKSIILEKSNDVTEFSLLVEEPLHIFENDTVYGLIKGLSRVKSICLGEGYIKSYNSKLDVDLPHAFKESKKDRCCLRELLKVDVKVNNAFKNTLNFIRFLLANSPSLAILTFTVSLAQDHDKISNILQDLKQMTQSLSIASTKAEVQFQYNEFVDQ